MNVLVTLKTSWDFLATVIENQAKCNRNVEVNAQNIGSNGSAKTKRSLQVHKALDETAAWQRRRGSNHNINQVEYIYAHS